MTIRDAKPSDTAEITRLLHENMGSGPYLDACLGKMAQDGSITLVGEQDGKLVSFLLALPGAVMSRTDFDGYAQLNALIGDKPVYTGYITVVDQAFSNRHIGHDMQSALFERFAARGVKLFFCECIVPSKWNDTFANGKLHWALREFDINILFYQYYPAYFSFTTPSAEDYCINCAGRCHCGAAIFLGEL